MTMESSRSESASQDSSRATSVLRNREVDDIFKGDLTLKHEPLSRTVRVYISSELSDATVEKKYLSVHAYPELRQYCQSLGLQLVVVDLYKNIPASISCKVEQSQLPETQCGCTDLMYELETNGLLDMAKKEIRLCQRLSSGPTFVTLLAQRYGHKPLHSHIPQEDFKLLLAAVDDNSMKHLVSEWYRLDTNALPAEYVLQSRTGMSLVEWKSIHQSLSKTTIKAAKVALGKDVTKAQHYTMSAIEADVTHGIFNLSRDPNQCCLWFKRTFTDLMEQRPSDPALSEYTDMSDGKRGIEFDSETSKVLNHLKEARMPAKYVGLDSNNIHEFSLKWQKNDGIDATNNPLHSDYLSELSDQFVDALKSKITDGFDIVQAQASDPIFQEILYHGAYAKEMGKYFMNRPVITSNILDYLQDNSNVPHVVHGALGSGKTAIMAGVANMLKKFTSLKKATLVLRFIRVSPESSSIRHLLLGISKQLSVVFKQDLSDVPGDYRSICEHVRNLLSLATAEQPVIVFLDGVDQLSPEDGALGLSWLPLKLPPHVKVVLSTSSETKYSCYPVLQSLLSNNQDKFIEVSPLTPTECNELLKHSLIARGRCLTLTQEQVAMKAFLLCPNPLYLQFLLREFTTWHSYLWNSTWTPEVDLKGVTERLFKEVETKLGRVFTRHALGYISASKHGLTEMELLDILACDDEVMQEVNHKWRPFTLSTDEEVPSVEKLTLVPPLLLSSFYHSLIPLLEYSIGIGGMLVLRLSQRHLEEVVNSLYRSSAANVHAIYSKLADYFGGKLFIKTTVPSDNCSTKKLEQPLMLNEENNLYNVRKLALLPYFLMKCGRLYELKKLLLEYDWLKASIHSISCLDVVDEFAAVLPLVPLGRQQGADDSTFELVLLRDTLSLSVDALNSDLECLSTQLLGRLMPYVRDSSSQNWPNLKRIVLKAIEDYSPPISPLQPLFNSPGSPLLITMEGHRDLVSCIAATIIRSRTEDSLTMVLISSSWDQTLKTWDIKTTGVLKTFDGHTDKVLSVALTANGQFAVSGSADKTIRHWLVATAECLCVMKGHKECVNSVALTSDGYKTISASSDSTIKVWNTDNGSETYGQLIFTFKNQKSPVISIALSDNVWLASLAKNGSTLVTNIISGQVCDVLQDREQSVTALATAHLESFKYIVRGMEDGTVRVSDMDSGRSLHALEPPGGSERGAVLTVAVRQKIVASYPDKFICVWDLWTGSYLYSLSGHSAVVHSCTLADNGSLAITGTDNNTIHVWDLQRSTSTKSSQQHTNEISSVVLSPCGNFGVSASHDSSATIYELATMNVLKELRGHRECISQVLAMRDSQHLLTASLDGTIKLWHGETGEVLKTFVCQEEAVTCIAVTMDAELLLSGGDCGKITFWSLKTGEKLKTFSNHLSSVVSVAFAKSSEFSFVVSVGQDGQVCVRDLQTAKVVFHTQPTRNKLLCASVSPNANLLAMGFDNTSCHILSIQDGKLLSILNGHKQAVTSVKILPNNRQCLTASLDRTIRLFDISSGECLAVFHTDQPVSSIDIDRQGEMIIYGTKKGWVSTAYNRQNELGPVMKELKGINSPLVSSIQTSTESLENSSEQLISSPPSVTKLIIEDNEPDFVSDSSSSVSTRRKEAMTKVEAESDLRNDSVDYPIDVNVEIVTRNDAIDSFSTIATESKHEHMLADSNQENVVEELETRETVPDNQTTTVDNSKENSCWNDEEIKQPLAGGQEDQPRSADEVTVSDAQTSSACSIL